MLSLLLRLLLISTWTIVQVAGQTAMRPIYDQYRANTRRLFNGRCTEQNALVRKEWGTLSPDERRAYIQAVRCLQSRPTRSSQYSSGARNRRDDWVVGHIIHASDVHFSPALFSYHREFLIQYERALREECGYLGTQPYWDYSRYGVLESSPLFDNSDISLGGNGHARPGDNCTCIPGPFSDFTVNLGPVNGGYSCRPAPTLDGLSYNPRCIERDFHPQYLVNATYEKVRDAILNFPDINSFALRIESWPDGLHPIPHETIGGLQEDIPASPSDPWFVCHHAMLDFIWAMWQSLDYENRLYAIASPDIYTPQRSERSWGRAPELTVNTQFSISPIFRTIRTGDAMSTIGGDYCYWYE